MSAASQSRAPHSTVPVAASSMHFVSLSHPPPLLAQVSTGVHPRRPVPRVPLGHGADAGGPEAGASAQSLCSLSGTWAERHMMRSCACYRRGEGGRGRTAGGASRKVDAARGGYASAIAGETLVDVHASLGPHAVAGVASCVAGTRATRERVSGGTVRPCAARHSSNTRTQLTQQRLRLRGTRAAGCARGHDPHRNWMPWAA